MMSVMESNMKAHNLQVLTDNFSQIQVTVHHSVKYFLILITEHWELTARGNTRELCCTTGLCCMSSVMQITEEWNYLMGMFLCHEEQCECRTFSYETLSKFLQDCSQHDHVMPNDLKKWLHILISSCSKSCENCLEGKTKLWLLVWVNPGTRSHPSKYGWTACMLLIIVRTVRYIEMQHQI